MHWSQNSLTRQRTCTSRQHLFVRPLESIHWTYSTHCCLLTRTKRRTCKESSRRWRITLSGRGTSFTSVTSSTVEAKQKLRAPRSTSLHYERCPNRAIFEISERIKFPEIGKLVCVFRDPALRRALLQKDGLTLKDFIGMGRSSESAREQVTAMTDTDRKKGDSEVFAVRSSIQIHTLDLDADHLQLNLRMLKTGVELVKQIVLVNLVTRYMREENARHSEQRMRSVTDHTICSSRSLAEILNASRTKYSTGGSNKPFDSGIGITGRQQLSSCP